MSAHKESQDKEIKALKEQVVTLTKVVNTILETEISFAPTKEKKEKSYDEMTNAEKVKHNRGK